MRNFLKRTYFWVYGKTNMGKPVVMGPYSEELKAGMISEKLDDSRVFNLKTKNMQQATRSIKASLVQDTGRVDEHVQPHGHQMEQSRSPFSNPFSSNNNNLADEILESSN